jgi:hypothetical protein
VLKSFIFVALSAKIIVNLCTHFYHHSDNVGFLVNMVELITMQSAIVNMKWLPWICWDDKRTRRKPKVDTRGAVMIGEEEDRTELKGRRRRKSREQSHQGHSFILHMRLGSTINPISLSLSPQHSRMGSGRRTKLRLSKGSFRRCRLPRWEAGGVLSGPGFPLHKPPEWGPPSPTTTPPPFLISLISL